jgi:opacity protein-like surface antigen
MEGDISWLGGTASSRGAAITHLTKGSKAFMWPGATARSSRVSALATLRGRFGWDFGGTMPYFTLGIGWGRTQNTWSVAFGPFNPGFEIGSFPAFATAISSTSWVPGLVLGGGVEHQLSQQWTLRGELMWVGFEGRQLNPALFSPGYRIFGLNGSPITFSNDLVIVKAGLNYRFGQP